MASVERRGWGRGYKDACDPQKLEEARNVVFPSDLDRMVI